MDLGIAEFGMELLEFLPAMGGKRECADTGSAFVLPVDLIASTEKEEGKNDDEDKGDRIKHDGLSQWVD